MPRKISDFSQVDPRAELGDDIEIGPFCVVGPHVKLGSGCKLDSHVTLTGHTTIGENNRFMANSVIGGEPQDLSYKNSPTQVVIGSGNQFREGVTVNRGADKEDHVTRIGNNNVFLANAHVGHNCNIGNNVMLVNGVLLGGHVHVHDKAIISGNTVVHQFCSIGTMAFVSGGCRVVIDVPPFMLGSGTDDFKIHTVNLVGLKRSGMSQETISLVRKVHKLVYREFKPLEEVKAEFLDNLAVIPIELSSLFTFMEKQKAGKYGRGREAVRLLPSFHQKAAA
jgi:UDP-N-acetylglucosamine acyltransferase